MIAFTHHDRRKKDQNRHQCCSSARLYSQITTILKCDCGKLAMTVHAVDVVHNFVTAATAAFALLAYDLSTTQQATTADTATAHGYCNKSNMRCSIQVSIRLCIQVHKGYNDGFITPRLSATADTADTAETDLPAAGQMSKFCRVLPPSSGSVFRLDTQLETIRSYKH
eukprot:15211-Heterococcus_DN1.PRE.2